MPSAVANPSRRALFGLPVAPLAAATASAVATAKAVATPPFAYRVLARAGFGPRPGDIEAFEALGANDDERLEAWVAQQIYPAVIQDPESDNLLLTNGFYTLFKSLSELWNDHEHGDPPPGSPYVDPGDPTNPYLWHILPIAEIECATWMRAVNSRRQLFEVMVGFWHDHFSVFGWEFTIGTTFSDYDRVMRTHAMGNFREFLEAVATSPAMLLFLDNFTNTDAGFNENYARELLELHTMGAENYYGPVSRNQVPEYEAAELPPGDPYVGMPKGYVDFDVYDGARAFTGWTFRNGSSPYQDQDDGLFTYRDEWHARGTKIVAGWYTDGDDTPMAEGRALLDHLANHPGTALHIAGKLCRKLIGDDYPLSVAQAAAAEFRAASAAPDQIARTVRVILLSDAFKTSWGGKVKRPFEAIAHALRATGTWLSLKPDNYVDDWGFHAEFRSRSRETGQGPFRWQTPDGYPDKRAKWMSTANLAMTWKALSRLVEYRVGAQPDPPFLMDIQGDTLAAFPDPAQRTAQNLVDFWLQRVHGHTALGARRTLLIDFLRQNAEPTAPLDLLTDGTDDGVPTRSGTWNDDNLSQHYTIVRLRTTVALMFLVPEFFTR